MDVYLHTIEISGYDFLSIYIKGVRARVCVCRREGGGEGGGGGGGIGLIIKLQVDWEYYTSKISTQMMYIIIDV